MVLTRSLPERGIFPHGSLTVLRRAVLSLFTTVLLALFLLFITLPVVSLFLRISPEGFFHSLTQPVVLDALSLSFVTATVSTAIVVLFGTPLAW